MVETPTERIGEQERCPGTSTKTGTKIMYPGKWYDHFCIAPEKPAKV